MVKRSNIKMSLWALGSCGEIVFPIFGGLINRLIVKRIARLIDDENNP